MGGGYGLSDDTQNDMTVGYIVEDYRKALKNAGIQPPYVLMPHSVGGLYATYWACNYPEEIEGVVFIDGTQMSAKAADEYTFYEVGFGDKLLAFLNKIGFDLLYLRKEFYHYPDNYSEDEQYLGDALSLMTMDSVAPISESGYEAKNLPKVWGSIVSNDIPKLFICSSWGMQTKEDFIEYATWMNRQREINHLGKSIDTDRFSDEQIKGTLDTFEKNRNEIIYPYAEKMGNCEVVILSGDHMIYEMKPQECGELIRAFLEKTYQ